MILQPSAPLDQLQRYTQHLYDSEYSTNTVKKYTRDIQKFLQFSTDCQLTKANTLAFKDHLRTCYAPTSANSILAAVNGFLDWLQLPQCKVKQLKIQKAIFAKPERELTKQDYQRLVSTAEKKNNLRLSLLIQTICATGIRVSELWKQAASTHNS